MSRDPTEAMLQLWGELRDLGIEEDRLPTARALEDWQQEGLIETHRRWPGRGKGSESRYAPGTAEKVVELIGILEGRRSFDWARMAIFYRGFDVDVELLRGSYVRVIDEWKAAAERSDEAELNEAIEAYVRRHSRTEQRRLLSQTFDESPTEVLASTMRSTLRLLLADDDTPLMPEDMDEMAVAHGVPLEIWEHLSPSEVDSFEDKLDIVWIKNAVSEITESALFKARNVLTEGLRDVGVEPAEVEDSIAPFLSVFALFSPEVAAPE